MLKMCTVKKLDLKMCTIENSRSQNAGIIFLILKPGHLDLGLIGNRCERQILSHPLIVLLVCVAMVGVVSGRRERMTHTPAIKPKKRHFFGVGAAAGV